MYRFVFVLFCLVFWSADSVSMLQSVNDDGFGEHPEERRQRIVDERLLALETAHVQ